jgi:hypothetical protein
MTELTLEDAVNEINVLNAAVEGSKQTIDDLFVQLRFWRQAAERAVNGWNLLEDRYEQLVQSSRDAAAQITSTLAHLEPYADADEDIPLGSEGDEGGYTVIESETIFGTHLNVGK